MELDYLHLEGLGLVGIFRRIFRMLTGMSFRKNWKILGITLLNHLKEEIKSCLDIKRKDRLKFSLLG